MRGIRQTFGCVKIRSRWHSWGLISPAFLPKMTSIPLPLRVGPGVWRSMSSSYWRGGPWGDFRWGFRDWSWSRLNIEIFEVVLLKWRCFCNCDELCKCNDECLSYVAFFFVMWCCLTSSSILVWEISHLWWELLDIFPSHINHGGCPDISYLSTHSMWFWLGQVMVVGNDGRHFFLWNKIWEGTSVL